MPADDLSLLERAAREAGEIALRYWRRDPQVWDKADGAGPVTEADLAVNAHLEQMLRAARPDYGWLSEESPDDPARLAAGHCFVIDPIDGTRAFIDGLAGFSHSLAIARGRDINGRAIEQDRTLAVSLRPGLALARCASLAANQGRLPTICLFVPNAPSATLAGWLSTSCFSWDFWLRR